MRRDLLVTRATFERLDDDHVVALVFVSFPCLARGACEELHLFALPAGYDPDEDGGSYAADEIRAHYTKEDD